MLQILLLLQLSWAIGAVFHGCLWSVITMGGWTGMELDIVKILAVMQSWHIDITGTLGHVWLLHCSLGFILQLLVCPISAITLWLLRLIVFLLNHLINVPSVLIQQTLVTQNPLYFSHFWFVAYLKLMLSHYGSIGPNSKSR